MPNIPRVAFTLGDVGSVECLGDVIKGLRQEAVVSVFVDQDGAGARRLAEYGIPFTEASRIDASRFDLLVCGTNGKALTLQSNATLGARDHGKEVIWCGDFYLSGCEAGMRDIRPDWLTVIDESAKELVRRVRTDISEDRIKVCGNASFDRLADLLKRREEIRSRVRIILGPIHQKLIIFSASASNQFFPNDMHDTLRGLEDYVLSHSFVRVVVFFHPADPKKTELERSITDQYGDNCASPMLVRDRMGEDWLGADAVVVQYSTEGVKSSLAVPTAFVLLKSLRAYQRTRGGKWPFFPQIEKGVAEGVWDPREIAPALDRMLYGEPDYYEAMEEARKKHFSSLTDGLSASRLSSFIWERLRDKGFVMKGKMVDCQECPLVREE